MMRIVVSIVLLVAALGSVRAVDATKAIGKRAMSFRLEDQFEQKWSWDAHWRGKPTIMVLSDWKGSDHLPTWTSTLSAKFKDRVQFASFADVSLAPGFLKGYLRERFREVFNTSVMLDWDGDIFTYYNAQPGLPNVLFVDASGIVRLHTWGKGTAEHVNNVANHLERMLAE